MAVLQKHIAGLVALLMAALLTLCIGIGMAWADEASYEEGHILVTLSDDASVEQAQQYFATTNWVDAARLEECFQDDSLGDVRVLPLAAGVSVEDAVAWALECSWVAAAQPDYVYDLPDDDAGDAAEPEAEADSPSLLSLTEELLGLSLPVNDPFDNGAAKSYWHLENIGAFSAWQRVASMQRATVTVAVIDSGCLVTHEDLVDNLLADFTYDAYTQKVGAEGFTDAHAKSHGTHVAGIVAATANNQLGTAGVSYNTQVLPIKVYYINSAGAVKSSTAAVKRAYTYLMDLQTTNPELNIRVVNVSLGAYTAPDEVLHKSIADAREAGILTVCAAGNGGVSKYIWPSDFEECLSVTALSSNGTSPASFSDYNAYKDICAPGQGIYSTIADEQLAYDYLSGTSMAAPVVSGALALLWSVHPNVSIDAMIEVIQETAAPLTTTAAKKGLYGAGRLDVDAALTALEQAGLYAVEDFAPGVYELTYHPLGEVPEGVPAYGDTAFCWAADQGCWVALVTEEPESFSVDDLTFDRGEGAVTVPRPGVDSAAGVAGDANGSGAMNIVDAQIAYERACGLYTFDSHDALSWLVCDVNGDGALDSADACAIQYAIHNGWQAAA